LTFWELFWVTIGSITVFSILLVLLVHGSKYSVHDSQAHSSDYGGVIKEGHGPVTAFLWVMFVSMFIWTIIYLVMHWHEFAIITAYSQ
jgi:hypothetical protein